MPKLIKNGAASDYTWQQLADSDAVTAADLSTGQYLLPLEQWLASDQKQGVWLAVDADPAQLAAASKAPTIAIEFGPFADGRGFSLARILREDCEYTGEIQATGGYIQDQLFYLKRCGFDAYVVPDDADIESMLTSLGDFTNSYQASADESRPLFRRR